MRQVLGFVLLLSSLICQAARQEETMSQMLISLHHEFVLKWNDIQANRSKVTRDLQRIDSVMQACSDDSKQCALTIYSTDLNSFQDVAFASQNSVDLYNSFIRRSSHYINMLNEYGQLVQRQDSLINVLSGIDRKTLQPDAQRLLPEAIALIGKIHKYDIQVLRHLQSLRPMYNETHKRLCNAKKTTIQKFELIRSNVLYDFDDNIIDILSDWDGYVSRMEKSKSDRWAVDNLSNAEKGGWRKVLDNADSTQDFSNWGVIRVVIMVVLIIFFIVCSLGLSLVVCLLRWIAKRVCILKVWVGTRFHGITEKIYRGIKVLSGIRTFGLVAIWVNTFIWWYFVSSIDYGYSISNIDTGYSSFDNLSIFISYTYTLLASIATCLILLYPGRNFWKVVAVTIPTLIAFFYSLFSNILVMPDDEMIFEGTFLTMALFLLQLLIHWKYRRSLDKMMMNVSRLSVVFLGISMVVAMMGLQFLSLMVAVFWCCFMVCMILLTSVKHYLDRLIDKLHMDDKTVKITWWVPVLNRVLYPMAWVYAVLLSCNIACKIYSLEEFLNQLLNTYFRTPLGNISVNISLLIFICWNILLAAYISRVLYQFVDYYHKSNGEMNWKDTSFFNQSVIRVLVWGVAVVNIMIHMGFSMQWVGYCMAGLSTGLGFASREIIENLIFGLTLRNGQLNIGDWIVCEGVRGQIKSIGLLSTRMDSVEGSVVTFTNKRLLSTNYENITLNHGYELLHTYFCICYGDDIEKVRNLLIEGYAQYEGYDKKRPVTVYCKKINNNQVDLDFRAWVLASDRIRMAAFNQEYVYKVLNANGIKYPYPSIEIMSK